VSISFISIGFIIISQDHESVYGFVCYFSCINRSGSILAPVSVDCFGCIRNLAFVYLCMYGIVRVIHLMDFVSIFSCMFTVALFISK